MICSGPSKAVPIFSSNVQFHVHNASYALYSVHCEADQLTGQTFCSIRYRTKKAKVFRLSDRISVKFFCYIFLATFGHASPVPSRTNFRIRISELYPIARFPYTACWTNFKFSLFKTAFALRKSYDDSSLGSMISLCTPIGESPNLETRKNTHCDVATEGTLALLRGQFALHCRVYSSQLVTFTARLQAFYFEQSCSLLQSV